MRRIALPALLFAIGATLIVAAIVRPPVEPGPFHGTYLGEDVAPSEFTLEAPDGAVSLSALRGSVVLLFFGYTSCPDVCPLTMSRLGRVMELLGDAAADVQVVFVSVDPEIDTAERTRRYATAFDASFLGLTGADATVRAAASGFGVYVGDPEAAAGAAAPDDAASRDHAGHAGHAAGDAGAAGAAPRILAHSPHVFGLDRRGARRLVWGQDITAEQLAADVRALLRL